MKSFKSELSLNCEALHQIGLNAAKSEWYDAAHVWLKHAYRVCLDENISLFNQIKSAYKNNVEAHDQVLESKGHVMNLNGIGRTFLIPINTKLRNKNKYKDIISRLEPGKDFEKTYKMKHYMPLIKENSNIWKKSDINKGQTRDNFHSLCRDGESSLQSQAMKANLNCRFLSHNISYLKMGPFLIEEKSSKPEVIMFHNFLSSIEAKYNEKIVGKQMKRSQTKRNKRDDVEKGHFKRTSKQGWVDEKHYRFPVTKEYVGWDKKGLFVPVEDISNQTFPEYPPNVQNYLIINDPLMYGITKRIELATGLVLDRPFASEPYQVVNYGIGGQYDAHLDAAGYHTYPDESQPISDKLKIWHSSIGDRQSTFMMYLSTVEAGGGTAFPLLGIKSNSKAGDALFWNNLLSDGKRDFLSVHGGCPIVIGSKWVTNKWILHYDNFRTTPCHLTEYKPIDTFHLYRKYTI